VKKSLLNMLGIAAITWSAQVSAAGIGGINVVSALGQPLRADIELVSVDKSEKASLVARLATPEAYKAAGLDYPFGNKFKFTIENRADGGAYVHAISTQPVNDPFVSLLLELSWSSGKLVREFTFLLDPVGYQAEQPVASPVQAVAPVVEPVMEAAPVTEEVAPVVSAVEPEQAAPASNAVVSTPIETAAETTRKKNTVKHPPVKEPVVKTAANQDFHAKAAEQGDITVQRGDTLSKIAAANQVDGVSLERMLVALYRANADRFDSKNMNRIKTGKILRRPDTKELETLTQADATKEIHAQVRDWNAYRQKIASAAPASAQQQTAQQVSAGKISSSVADKTPVAKEAAKEVLKLSKGEAITDKAGVAGKTSSQDKKNAAQEEAIAKAKAAEEEHVRVALLEKQVQDMNHLAELKAQAAALAKAASAPVVASAVEAVSSVGAVSAVQPVAKPKPQVKPVVVQSSMLDDLLADPLYLAGGAAALLGLGGLIFASSRRKKTTKSTTGSAGTKDLGSVTGRIAEPVVPSPDTGDFTIHASNTQPISPSHSEDDPISEADLFLSFGRDAQAEEILKEALQSWPNKTPIKMKLLDIYVARKDAKLFEALAAKMESAVDDKTWQQVVGMGRKLDPQNTLYGGAAKVEDSDSATMQTVALSAAPDLTAKTLARTADFKITGTQPAALDMNLATTMIFSQEDIASAKNAVMDLDVTGTNPSRVAPLTMDFDVTATHSKAESGGTVKAEMLPNLDDLVFDVTSTHPSMPAARTEPAVLDDGGMPFTLDFPIESGAAKVSEPVKSAEFNLSDINLNLGDDKLAAKSGGENAQWHEVATKLDLAKAYQEMGDADGAREILREVLNEGDAEQRAAAQEILAQLG
jgi:pilus assembly protein FimV